MSDDRKAPAGWHPDPENPGQMRYWDGNAWTEHRAQATPLATVGRAKSPKPWWRRTPVIVIGVVVTLLILGALNPLGDDEQSEAAPATPSASPSESTIAPAPEPEPSAAEPETEPEPEVEPEPVAFTAEDVDAELRTQLGLGADGSYQSLDPTSWGFYVADIALPEQHLLRVTMQTDGDDPLVEDSSRAIFSLVGSRFPDLDFVEVMDGSGVHIEQTSRRDVPLLNR